MSVYKEHRFVMGRQLTTRDVAEYFGITPSAVENWRARGKGPRCYRSKRGRWVYAFEDIRDFVLPIDQKNAILAKKRSEVRRLRWRCPDLESWLRENHWVHRDTALDEED